MNALLTIGCPCGRRLATIRRDGAELRLEITHARTLPPAHLGAEMTQWLLMDLELIANDDDPEVHSEHLEGIEAMLDAMELWEDNDELHRFIGKQVPYRTGQPGRAVDITGLRESLSALRDERAREGLAPPYLVGFDAPCGKCRKVWYLGNQVASWQGGGERPGRMIAREQKDAPAVSSWVPMETSACGLGQRVAVYRRLAAVLTSEAQRKKSRRKPAN